MGHLAADSLTIVRRNLTKIRRVPDLLVFTTLQPIMFVLLFGFVFGAINKGDAAGYREFMMAGIFAQTIVFGATLTGYGMAEDMSKGVIDRFRTLPMHPGAVLVGRARHERRGRRHRACLSRPDASAAGDRPAGRPR